MACIGRKSKMQPPTIRQGRSGCYSSCASRYACMLSARRNVALNFPTTHWSLHADIIIISLLKRDAAVPPSSADDGSTAAQSAAAPSRRHRFRRKTPLGAAFNVCDAASPHSQRGTSQSSVQTWRA